MNNLLSINNNLIVSTKELNLILGFIKNNNYTEIDVIFQNSIDKFDIVFIAGLILLWHNKKIMFNITYKDTLPHKRIFEVRQYLQQYQKIFNNDWKNVFIKFKNITELTDNDYRASEAFAPIIFVNKDTINKLFSDTEEVQIGSEVSTLCQKYINEKITYQNKEEEIYLNSITSIKNKLLEYPPIYTFVFTVLYNKISPFVNSSKKGIIKPSQRTEQLWEFTMEYIKGLHELAKNIVEHSETGEGIITIRAYDEENIENNVNGNKVLETHVFDFGTKGIVPKLIDDTTNKKNLSRVYEDDLIILNGAFEMKDFIVPSVKTKLNQQLYRDIAHYGLMKFYKLILRNEGVVVSSSTGKNTNRDFFPLEEAKNEKALLIGTSYYFQLPFKHDLFKAVEYTPPSIDWQGSPHTVSSISELLKLKIIESYADFNNNHSNGYNVLIIVKPDIEINNRNDEEYLFRLFTELKGKKIINYIAINFLKVRINDSSLLRFLAHLSTNYTQSIILYNLDFEIYDEMVENNKHFFHTLNDLADVIPFWYENKGILIFTRLKDLNFNFADILYGVNDQEFQSINRIVSHTFPNTLSITQENISPTKDFDIPVCLRNLFFQSSLLPFDLLFLDNSNKSLFLSNLETLLMQELNAYKFDEILRNE